MAARAISFRLALRRRLALGAGLALTVGGERVLDLDAVVAGKGGEPAAPAALVTALDDPEARWAAVEALGRIADPRSLQALAKLLGDLAADPACLRALGEASGRLAVPDAARRIADLIEQFPGARSRICRCHLLLPHLTFT